MNCKKCGMSVMEDVKYCPNCGYKVDSNESSSAIGWGVLGFCIPIVGVILAFAFLNSNPKAAKYSGVGALIAFLLTIILKIINEYLKFLIENQ